MPRLLQSKRQCDISYKIPKRLECRHYAEKSHFGCGDNMEGEGLRESIEDARAAINRGTQGLKNFAYENRNEIVESAIKNINFRDPKPREIARAALDVVVPIARRSAENYIDKTLGGEGAQQPGQDEPKPGAMLKKKVLSKIVRDRRMAVLRKQSMDKTMPDSKGHVVGMGKQKGGFIVLALTGLIGAISAAASAAMATTVGTTTVGALVAASATGAATAAGAAAGKRVIEKLAGKGIKQELLTTIKSTKLKIEDLPPDAKRILLAGYKKLKDNPTMEGIKELGKQLAPHARKAMASKVGEKLGLTGGGLKLAGQGGGSFNSIFSKIFEHHVANK